jgi:hypothetical protein
MRFNLTDIAIGIYFSGMLFCLLQSINTYINMQSLGEHFGVDILNTKSGMKFYLIAKPVLWPYYFCIEKSPLERVSELFFKHYGDEGHTYFGSQGIRNFFNDVFRGKGRYDEAQVQLMCWPVCKNSKMWLGNREVFSEDKEVYAKIIYAQINGNYLLGIVLGNSMNDYHKASVSRFQLDECECLTQSKVIERLHEVNSNKAHELFV